MEGTDQELENHSNKSSQGNSNASKNEDLKQKSELATEAEENNERSTEGSVEQIDKEEIEKYKAEAKENYEKYLRCVAELENLKRRSTKEKSDIRQFATENLLKDMLPVLDSFEKGLFPTTSQLEHEHPSNDFVSGMCLVQKQLLETLEKHGLEKISAKGEAFDPNFHQAVQKLETEDTDIETVKEEYATGYTLHGRLLRPSMVCVQVPK